MKVNLLSKLKIFTNKHKVINSTIETNNKLYILVSNQLNPIYGAVQGGHAIAQFLIEHPDSEWKNNTVVYLSCDMDNFLNRQKNRHQLLKDELHSVFKEPDLDNQITAIACYKIPQKYVNNLKLLR